MLIDFSSGNSGVVYRIDDSELALAINQSGIERVFQGFVVTGDFVDTREIRLYRGEEANYYLTDVETHPTSTPEGIVCHAYPDCEGDVITATRNYLRVVALNTAARYRHGNSAIVTASQSSVNLKWQVVDLSGNHLGTIQQVGEDVFVAVAGSQSYPATSVPDGARTIARISA